MYTATMVAALREGLTLTSPEDKQSGAYYTPADVVASLVSWAVRSPGDRLLDPSCGDGRFLALHQNSVGVEQDAKAAAFAQAHLPGRTIYLEEFFSWAGRTNERFECAA